jgi:hypothetical protein
VFGPTPSKYQSDEIDRTGAISRCEDDMMRMMLYEAAQSIFHSTKADSFLGMPYLPTARYSIKKFVHAVQLAGG